MSSHGHFRGPGHKQAHKHHDGELHLEDYDKQQIALWGSVIAIAVIFGLAVYVPCLWGALVFLHLK